LSDDKMLTVQQVADHIQVNPETVRNWIRTGELDALDIGGEYRISRADLDDFIQRRKTSRRKKKD
jgi:excisionase family DNA binding protein